MKKSSRKDKQRAKTGRVTLNLSKAEYASLRIIAQREKRTMSWMGGEAIRSLIALSAARFPDALPVTQSAIDFEGEEK